MNMLQIIEEKSCEFEMDDKAQIITFLNPHSYLIARNHLELFSKVDRIYIDGIALVWFLRLAGLANIQRTSFDFTSLAKEVIEQLNKNRESVYLIGSKKEEISKAVENLKSRFPNLNIVGFRDGFFESSKAFDDTILDIAKLKPRRIIAGMGTPLQESFLIDLRNSGWQGTGYTCGGFLHQTAVRLEYYPNWVNRIDLRWLYRIYNEPKLIKRYVIRYPIFMIVCLIDLVKWIWQKKSIV